MREEVCAVDVVGVEDGDCGGFNEDLELETLDEVPRFVMLNLVLE